MIRKFRKFCKTRRIGGWIIFYLAIYIVFIIKFLTIKSIDFGVIFGVYSVTVSIYILSRFALAYIYKPELPTDNDFEPTITFGVPTKNEEDVIRKTILSIAESDYPKSKFDIIAIDDGSSDDTLHEMRIAQKIVEQPCRSLPWRRMCTTSTFA